MNTTTLNIEEFNPKKVELQELAKEIAPILEVKIVDNKTRKEVHEAQMKLRASRLEIQKTGKAMREDALAFQKKVISVENEFIGIISPIEDELKEKKEAYDEEIQRKKEEEERKKQESIASRVQALAEYGENYDSLKHSPEVMSDVFFSDVLKAYEVRKQEEEKAKKEQEEKEKREREEFEKKQKELEEKQKRIDFLETSKKRIEETKTLEELEKITNEIVEYDYGMDADIAPAYNKQKEYLELQEEKRKLEAEKERIEQERIDAENEKKRQAELEQARKEAQEKAKKDAELEAERKQLEAEKQKREAEEQKKAEEEKLARKRKYKLFLDKIGYCETEKDKFTFIDTDEGRKFYKFVGIYK